MIINCHENQEILKLTIKQARDKVKNWNQHWVVLFFQREDQCVGLGLRAYWTFDRWFSKNWKKQQFWEETTVSQKIIKSIKKPTLNRQFFAGSFENPLVLWKDSKTGSRDYFILWKFSKTRNPEELWFWKFSRGDFKYTTPRILQLWEISRTQNLHKIKELPNIGFKKFQESQRKNFR
jgi:hypothetical protein